MPACVDEFSLIKIRSEFSYNKN